MMRLRIDKSKAPSGYSGTRIYYTSGRERSLRKAFGFVRPPVLFVRLTFVRFGLDSWTTAGPAASEASASTTADIDAETDVASAGTEEGHGEQEQEQEQEALPSPLPLPSLIIRVTHRIIAKKTYPDNRQDTEEDPPDTVTARAATG